MFSYVFISLSSNAFTINWLNCRLNQTFDHTWYLFETCTPTMYIGKCFHLAFFKFVNHLWWNWQLMSLMNKSRKTFFYKNKYPTTSFAQTREILSNSLAVLASVGDHYFLYNFLADIWQKRFSRKIMLPVFFEAWAGTERRNRVSRKVKSGEGKKRIFTAVESFH